MKYAIVDFKGHQIPVKEGQTIDVDRIEGKEGDQIDLDQVLLIANKNITIGQPTVTNASVKATIVEHFKGKKIRVATYKAKSRYRRVKGFRPLLTKIKIDKIEIKAKSKSPKKAKKVQK